MPEILVQATNLFYIGHVATPHNDKGLPIYGNERDADSYFQGRLFSGAWDEADLVTRNKALQHATKIINRLNYSGKKTSEVQENEFPRNGAITIPTQIKHACYEIALKLLEGVDPDIEVEISAKTSTGFAGVKSDYGSRDFVHEHTRAGIPSASAWTLLRQYVLDPHRVNLRRNS